MTAQFCVVERIGARTPGGAFTSGGRLDEAAPRSRKSAQRSFAGAPRRSGGARSVRGDVCFYVGSQGRQHFNFPQRIWPYPSVPMAVTPVMSIKLETLAINLLTPLTRQCDCRAAVGVTEKPKHWGSNHARPERIHSPIEGLLPPYRGHDPMEWSSTA